jgi:ATP-dependent Lon protease
VGNFDLSVEQAVNSTEYDLFQPLPPQLDLAVMDRFACYVPGWEMPKNSSEYLTDHYGFITDYLAEAFHYQFSHTHRYEEVNQRIRLSKAVEGRDEKASRRRCVPSSRYSIQMVLRLTRSSRNMWRRPLNVAVASRSR